MLRALAICKKSTPSRFVFLIHDDSEGSVKAACVQFARFAMDPELDFTWSDAAFLAQRLRDEVANKPI